MSDEGIKKLIDYVNGLPKRFPLDVFVPDAGFYKALDENRRDDSAEPSDEEAQSSAETTSTRSGAS